MSKVLIIEDDPPYRKIYSRKFEVAGYEVETAENGALGLEKARNFKPNIILTDLMMPQVDGFQLLDKLKADPELAIIPVVVLTNLSTSNDAQKVIEKGALAIMVKSNSEPNDIVEKVNQILSSTGA